MKNGRYFNFRDICDRNLWDTGYSQKIVTYQMFDEKRSWITKYMPVSVFLQMIR